MHSRPSSTVSALLCYAALAPAYAADPTLEELLRLPLEEMANVKINIASMVETDQLYVSSSVAVVTRDDWERRGARRTAGALSSLPATLVLPYALAADNVAIRGYARASDTGVAILWDSTPMNDLVFGNGLRTAPNLGLSTLDRIQVVQGTGSALHGNDAFHGVIAYDAFETQKDTRVAGAKVASDGYYAADARLSTPLYDGARINFALAGSGQPDQHRSFHYTDPTTDETRSGERANQYNAQTVSAKIASDPQQPWSYRVGVFAHHYDGDDFNGLGTRASQTQDLSGQTSDLVMSRATLTRSWSEQRKLQFNAYGWQVDNDFASRLQPGASVLERHVPATQDRVGAQLSYRDTLGAATRWALELGAERLRLWDARIRTYSDSGALLSDVEHPANHASRQNEYLALEGQTRVTNRVRLSYGGRIDHYSDIGRHASPRAGVIYQLHDETVLKLQYGQAYRVPTAAELNGSPGTLEGNMDLDPETIDSYELGLLRRHRGGQTEFTLFHSMWKNAIAVVANPGGSVPLKVENSGENRASGISGRWSYAPGPWLADISGSYVYSESKETGDRYTLFPLLMLNAGLGYHFVSEKTQVFLNQRFFSGATDVDANSAGFASENLKPYWRVDLTAMRALSNNVSLSLEMRNILDRSNALPSPAGSRGGIPDEPFSIGLGIAYQM